MLAQLTHEAIERFPFLCRVRFGVAVRIDDERPPRLKFFDVLEHDHARFALCRPAQRDPGQAANLLLDWFSTFGLAEVLAIWRQPDKADRLIVGDLDRIYVPHAFAQVLRMRMVRGVHRERLRIVVDRNIDRTVERLFKSFAGASATGKVVNDQFAAQVQRERHQVTFHFLVLCIQPRLAGPKLASIVLNDC